MTEEKTPKRASQMSGRGPGHSEPEALPTKPTQSWGKCGACTDGRTNSATSVEVCQACQGTGIDLTDARLDAAIMDHNISVRVRKGLKREGVANIRQLVCHAVAGNLKPTEWMEHESIEEARSLLASMGLPAGPAFDASFLIRRAIEVTQCQSGKRASQITGQVLGHSEREALSAVAVLTIEAGKAVAIEFRKFFSPHQIVGAFSEGPRPLGVGSAEWLAVGAGREGWRAADYWINEAPFHRKDKYDEFPFHGGPSQGQCRSSLAAIALVTLLRRRWSDLPVTEASPEEYYTHLVQSPEWHAPRVRVQILAILLGLDLPAKLSDGEWEAAMAAYAMWKGLGGDWPIDLHRLTRPAMECWEITAEYEKMYWQPALSRENLIFPAGPVSFFWPPDERLAEM